MTAGDDRLLVALAAFGVGYFLLELVEVSEGEPVTGSQWARVWDLVRRAGVQSLFVRGPVDMVALEPVAAELRLVIRQVGDADVGDAGIGAAGVVGPATPELSASSTSPLPPPRWATRSIAEDGGITHETVSPLRPTIIRSAPHGWELVPTEVTLSVTDLHINGQWIRSWPMIQVEGGSYSPQGAPQLGIAVRTFVAMTAADGAGQASQAS